MVLATRLFIPALLLALPALPQITVTSSPQSVGLTSPTPINCTPPGQAVTCTAPAPTITLPIEVFGPDGYSTSVTFTLPTAPSGSQLWLQVHGLRYDSEASVQVNNSVWLPLSTGNVTLQGNAQAFGGIGGGFSTIAMLVNLPAGVVASGLNTVSFRFNGTDGVSSGYRVLGLNIQVGGSNLLPIASFVYDDPATWKPPLPSPPDIAAGKALWTSAALSDPAGGAMAPIKAHCADCHTADGRDLKYFNYSNLSIEGRAAFHGLTAIQGQQLASYIRSLTTPSPGRPWNPPYQPGPGVDSQPVATWAAGAGLSAVLDGDADMLAYLMPNGSTAGWDSTAYLNPRQTPIAFQLLDWNSWLPIVHPVDSFGTAFTNSQMLTAWAEIATNMKSSANLSTAYKTAAGAGFQHLNADQLAFFKAINSAGVTTWTPALRQSYYSFGLWNMVKQWEFNQVYGVEGIPASIYGTKANPRGWMGGTAFSAAPNLQHVPPGPGLANGLPVMKDYLSMAWYQLQLVLNDGQGQQTGHSPIDYPYVGGFIWNLFSNDPKPPLQGMYLQLEYLIKSFQEVTLTGIGPEAPGGSGWHLIETSPMPFVLFYMYPLWGSVPVTQQGSIATAYAQLWFTKVSSFTPSQLYAGGWAVATDDPATIGYASTLGGSLWYMLPRLRFIGVPATLTSQISAWAKTIWPVGNWAANDTATCTDLTHCTSGL